MLKTSEDHNFKKSITVYEFIQLWIYTYISVYIQLTNVALSAKADVTLETGNFFDI